MRKKTKKRNIKYYHFVRSMWAPSHTDDLCKDLIIEEKNLEKAFQKARKIGCSFKGDKNAPERVYCLEREITDFPFQMEAERWFFVWEAETEEKAKEIWLKRFTPRNITSLEILREKSNTPIGVLGAKKIFNIEEYSRFIAAKYNFSAIRYKTKLIYRNGNIKEFL